MRLRFVIVLIFLNIFWGLSSHAFHTEWESPTLDPAADDPWKNRLVTKLPKAVLDQLYEKNKVRFDSQEDFLFAIQMTGAQQQLKRIGDFAYDDRILIGMGEEGRVYLAQHTPTGFYMAVKTPVRKTECEAFKNLGRCYACFKINSQYYLYTPFIMGTPLSEYSLDEERLGVTVDQNNVTYRKWPHNLKLLDAFLAELERCVKYKGIPRELDYKSIFVIDDSPESKVVFVDLETGEYIQKGQDYIPDEFYPPMFLLLGSQGSSRMWELGFPEPIQRFFEKANEAEGGFFRLTKLKEARNQLMEEMQQLGYPGLTRDESTISSGHASSSSPH